MSKKRSYFTASEVEKMVKRGRGQGIGKSFTPWIIVRDGSSLGFSSRIKGWKTGRVHHFRSKLETSLFYLLDWSDQIGDIREKVPLLPINKTLDIAHRFSLNHPFDFKKGEPIVLTTDFLVEVKKERGYKLLAISVMYHNAKARAVKRAFIERTYWAEKGIEFKIITEKDVSQVMVRNIQYVHASKNPTFAPAESVDRLVEIENTLFWKMNESNDPTEKSCAEADKELGLRTGTSLWVLKYLIANRLWIVDIRVMINTAKPLVFKRNIDLIQ